MSIRFAHAAPAIEVAKILHAALQSTLPRYCT